MYADGRSRQLCAPLTDADTWVLTQRSEQEHWQMEHLWPTVELVGEHGPSAPASWHLHRVDSRPLSSGASAGFVRAETCLEKAPFLIRAGGKVSPSVCSEQELIKIQKVISLVCPLITGNLGRPDQT